MAPLTQLTVSSDVRKPAGGTRPGLQLGKTGKTSTFLKAMAAEEGIRAVDSAAAGAAGSGPAAGAAAAAPGASGERCPLAARHGGPPC